MPLLLAYRITDSVKINFVPAWHSLSTVCNYRTGALPTKAAISTEEFEK